MEDIFQWSVHALVEPEPDSAAILYTNFNAIHKNILPPINVHPRSIAKAPCFSSSSKLNFATNYFLQRVLEELRNLYCHLASNTC